MTTAVKTSRKPVFNSLEVHSVERLTKDSVVVSFAVPEELREDYTYVPGQYIALRAEIDGQEVRRSYSLCDVFAEGLLKVAIKKDRGGVFSTWANEELSPGMHIEVMNPQGNFTSRSTLAELNDPEALSDKLAELPQPHLVAFAAGSGITPIMAISRSILARSPQATMEIVYANKGAGDVMFAEELGDLKDKYPTRFCVHHVLSREQRVNPLYSGRIDHNRLETLLDRVIATDEVDEWFLCGPFDLVQMLRDELANRGVGQESVRFELFTTGKPSGEQRQSGKPVEVDPEADNIDITFQLDGLSVNIKSPVDANESLLNAALRARSDVPFACAGGVCGTCRAKLVKGEVDMAENYALEPDEVANGYVLTCQSKAKTREIELDFDA